MNQVNRLIQGLLLVGLMAWMPWTAQGTPVAYEATTAGGSIYNVYSVGHAFWLPGYNGNSEAKWVFTGGTGDFIVDQMAGIATLTGRIELIGDASQYFDVDITYNLITTPPLPSGSPKLELSSSAYASNGGPVDPTTWSFWEVDEANSTLSNSAVTYYLSMMGPAHQMGIGANGKNIEFGFSGWFNLKDASGNVVALSSNGSHGDININLTATGEVPEPTTIAIVGAGVLTLARRKRL